MDSAFRQQACQRPLDICRISFTVNMIHLLPKAAFHIRRQRNLCSEYQTWHRWPKDNGPALLLRRNGGYLSKLSERYIVRNAISA